MQLQLIRTYTKIGMVGQLWNSSCLLLYCMERNTCKDDHSCLFHLPEGNYLLKPAAAKSPGLVLTSQSDAGEIGIAIFTQAAEVTLIRGCDDPLCIITPDGEMQLTASAMQNLEDIFYRGYQKVSGISLSIENTFEYELNKTGL